MLKKNIRIQFVDTDASQRIHYSAIFRYFEIMDHDFFRSIGFPYKKIFQLGLAIPRVHAECSYMEEIEYDDELEAQVSVTKLGHSSFTLSFHFYKENRLAAKGSLTNVFIDRTTGKSVKIPDPINEALQQHLESLPE